MLHVLLAAFWFAAFAVFLTWAIRRRYHDDDDRDGSVPA